MRASSNFLLLSVLLISSWQSATSQQMTITTSQISTTRITNTDSTLQSSQCRCDRYSICDDLCCCDTDCPADTISAWKKQDLCVNKEYIYSLSAIPLCSEKRPKTLGDLQAGLRIYYQILKILFCVVFDNSSADDLYKTFKTDENIAQGVAVATASVASTSPVYLETPSGSSFARVNIPRQGFGTSQCTNEAIVYGDNLEGQDCFYKATTIADFCLPANTFINPPTYQSLTIRKRAGGSDTITPTVSIFTRDMSSIAGYTLNTAGSLGTAASYTAGSAPDANDCVCNNFVSEVNYRFVIESDNVIASASMDVVITTAESFACSGQVLVKQRTSVAFLNSEENYLRMKGPGYRMGDPILFGKNTTATNFNMYVDPMSFSFLDSDGECALATGTVDQKYSSGIRFGYRNTFTCSIGLARLPFRTFCQSPATQLQMYANILNNLRYIGIFPNANPTLSKDWFYISPVDANSIGGGQTASETNCPISAPILSIFYSAFGEQMDPGFKINSAEVTIAETETLVHTAVDDITEQTFTFRLYVDFIRLAQGTELFVAPNPTARLSLPDNVLTPFITKKT